MTYYTQYRHLALEGAKPAATAQQIAAIETLLEAPLPPAFLAFLQVANGAWFDYTTDVPDGNGGVEKMGFNTFFSADEGDFCDETLDGEIRAARQHTDMPVRILPFARDGGKPAPTAQQIAAIETLLEAPLPPAFLAFLQVAIPFWPEAAFAQACASGDWMDFQPRAIALDDFLTKWLPGMAGNDQQAFVFPVPQGSVSVAAPADLLADLRGEARQYE